MKNRKMGKKNVLLLVMLFVFSLIGTSNLNAQQGVTIGLGEEPERAAALQIKDQTADDDNVTAKQGGLLLPRVQLEQRNELLPFISGATDYDKRVHTGLVVYNLKEVEDEDLKIGLNYWDGEKWNPLVIQESGKSTYAIVNCEMVEIEGALKSGTPLNSGNVMKLTVNVTKPGNYTVLAKTEPSNGYYFTASGEFLVAGIYEIIALGAGTPVTAKEGTVYDEVLIDLNGERSSCSKLVNVEDTSIQPKFSLSCTSVKLAGAYQKGIALNGTNTITVTINVENGAQGAQYHVYTNELGGMKFEGKGVLSGAGSYDIVLYGSGTPTDITARTFTITTNSQTSAATCQVTIQPVIGKKKIVEFAYAAGATYGLASGGSWGPAAMLKDNMNYGDNVNSIVKYLGFSSVTHVAGGAVTATMLRNNAGLGTSQPADIIIFTYDARPYLDEAVSLLVDYVNNGGVLIYMDQTSDTYHRSLLSQIFGETVSTTNMVNIGATADYVIKMNSAVDDEIINGPFGDCRNSQWGDDLANTRGLTFVPNNAIVYAGGINARTGTISSTGTQVSVMKHKTKNFFWFGDSGFIASGGQSFTGQTSNPFRVAGTTIGGAYYPKYPVTKPHGYYAGNLNLPVCNSIFFANLMAWAIKTAEESGINSGK